MRLLKHEVEETKLKAIFASSPDAITTSDLNGNITDCNQATLDLHGYSSKEEMIGKSAFELIAKKDHKRAKENLKKTLEQGSVRNIEYTFLAKDGREFPAELSASVVKDSSGKPIGFVAVTKDITERKRAEEVLRDSEKNWSNSFNSLEDVMVIINKDYTIEKINDKGLKLLGKTREEVIGKKCYQVIHGLDAPGEFCPFKRTLKTGKVESVDRYEKLLGKYFNIKSSPIFNERGEIVRFVDLMRDITERKQMEKKLEAYSQQLEKLVEKRTRQLKEAHKQLLKSERLAAIGEVATMVGHDLRNPLQSIENATYYLNNELPRLPPSTPNHKKTMEMLQVINDSVNYADKVIKDLQDFSATKKPTLKKTNINTIVKETLSQVETPKNVELTTELRHLPEITADKDMIKRAFLNLAINGIQAMENGGTLKVSTKKTKGFVEVSFKDTSIGIPKENMEKIFSPFFTTRAKGMGMGLPVCKKFVDAHCGSIKVESEEGKGSTFTVKLPI